MKYRNDHDVSLPSWGPYSKQYFGVSHMTSRQKGLRFDLCLVPGRFRSEFFPPHAVKPSGWLPWDAEPGLSLYSYRQQIVWKDQVYAHVTIHPDDSGARLEVELVNNTPLTEALCLHLCARMTAPTLPGKDEPLSFVRANFPAGAIWTRALDYAGLEMEASTPYHGLNYDAALTGEVCAHGFTDGYGLGDGFGSSPVHRVRYTIPAGAREALIRWRGDGDSPSVALVGGGEKSQRVTVEPGEFSVQAFPLAPGQREILITCENGQPLQIDGLAFGPEGFAEEVCFEAEEAPLRPQVQRGERQVGLDYAGHGYRLHWDEPSAWVREVLCDDIGHGVLRLLHNHVSDLVDMGGQAHVLDVFFGPLDVPAGQTRRLSLRVEQTATSADGVPRHIESTGQSKAAPSAQLPPTLPSADAAPNESAAPVAFARDRLRAVVMTNVVYPIRAKGHWVRHFTPGRWWDSLYTWDSGCIGLGLSTIDPQRAVDNLLAYLCDPGDTQTAFVHHGSMVPTQFYQAQEIWNRTRDKDLLAHLWPRLEQYFGYFVGWHPGSTMRPFASGLLVPWDYFYNSGGWDDYPPQHALRANPGRRKSFAPCVTSSHAIRCAKMMTAFADILGRDPAPFLKEAADLTDALQRHAWDEEEGFFGYVGHDSSGQPEGILRDNNGCHFNRGMDGLTPLLAGAVHGPQAERMWGLLLNPARMLTELGLATVDMQAPYFSAGGYWNGSVWMPYQWFFWKALLDYGRAEAAHDLAARVLKIYGQETHERYVCQEHYMITSGRGAGWHHFSGLSSPVLNLFTSYYTPGTVTGGHGFFLLEQQWNGNVSQGSFTARYDGEGNSPRSLLITLPAGPQYRVRVNGEAVTHSSPLPGCLSLTRDWGRQPFRVVIECLS